MQHNVKKKKKRTDKYDFLCELCEQEYHICLYVFSLYKTFNIDKNYSLCLFLRGKLAKRVSRWFLLEIFPPMTYAYGKENKNGKP